MRSFQLCQCVQLSRSNGVQVRGDPARPDPTLPAAPREERRADRSAHENRTGAVLSADGRPAARLSTVRRKQEKITCVDG